jgi:hypothetical protein
MINDSQEEHTKVCADKDKAVRTKKIKWNDNNSCKKKKGKK